MDIDALSPDVLNFLTEKTLNPSVNIGSSCFSQPLSISSAIWFHKDDDPTLRATLTLFERIEAG